MLRLPQFPLTATAPEELNDIHQIAITPLSLRIMHWAVIIKL
jgi:hypothetical protein